MIQKDFIMRYLEEAARVLAAVIGLKAGGRYEEAQQHLNDSLKLVFGLKGKVLDTIPENEVVEHLLSTEGFDFEQLDALSDILFERADIEWTNGDRAKALGQFRKVGIILKYLDKYDTTYSMTRASRLAYIQDLKAIK